MCYNDVEVKKVIKLKVKLLDEDRVGINQKNSDAKDEEYIAAIHHLIIESKKNNVSIDSLKNIINKDLNQ